MHAAPILAGLVLAALFAPSIATAQEAGDQFQLSRTTEAEWRDTRGSSGNTHDSDMLIERVVTATPAGVELEYSLPPGQQSSDWTLPLRIFKPLSGPPQLRKDRKSVV